MITKLNRVLAIGLGVDPNETGGSKRRANRRVVTWLKAHSEKYKDITIQ